MAIRSTQHQGTGEAGEVRIGLWGFCALGAENTGLTDFGACSKPAYGYDPAPFLAVVTGQQDLVKIAFTTLTYILIIHPIVAALTLMALAPSLFVRHKWARIFSLVMIIISAILSTVVFGIDFTIVTVAMAGVRQYLGETSEVAVFYGREVWMSLAAVILLWVAVVADSAVSCFCCGRVMWKDKGVREKANLEPEPEQEQEQEQEKEQEQEQEQEEGKPETPP